GGDQPDHHRDLGAVHDPAVDVAAQLVGAEPVGAARRLEGVEQRGLVEVIRRHPVGEDGHGEEQQHDGTADGADRLAHDEIAEQRHPAWARVRGSIRKYVRSTSRLTPITKRARNSNSDWKIGKSRWATDSTSRLPLPGSWNSVSMTM